MPVSCCHWRHCAPVDSDCHSTNYRALGFTLDAVDISFYSGDDLARGEVAVFMKKDAAQPKTGETSIFHLDE